MCHANSDSIKRRKEVGRSKRISQEFAQRFESIRHEKNPNRKCYQQPRLRLRHRGGPNLFLALLIFICNRHCSVRRCLHHGSSSSMLCVWARSLVWPWSLHLPFKTIIKDIAKHKLPKTYTKAKPTTKDRLPQALILSFLSFCFSWMCCQT